MIHFEEPQPKKPRRFCFIFLVVIVYSLVTNILCISQIHSKEEPNDEISFEDPCVTTQVVPELPIQFASPPHEPVTNPPPPEPTIIPPPPEPIITPPPAWPQQDHYIRDCIRSGHRIDYNQTPTIGDSTQYIWNGTTCEAPPKNMATIVTAYYDMSSKHATQNYGVWVNNLLRATDPMIIFVDPTSNYKNWWPIVERGRQHAPTLLVALPFGNLTMSTVFSDTFWKQYILPRDRKVRFKKGVDVYKIWNEKIILMHEAALENPFETEFFYWMDFGYYRFSNVSPNYTPIVRNNITEKGVNSSHQLVYQMISDWPTYEIAGGAWGGTVDAIKVHYRYYWKTFWYLTLYSTKECVGYEQRVLVWMCRSYPKLCVINQSTGKDWFMMGQRWLRKRTFNMTAYATSIPMDNTTTVPPVPNYVAAFPKGSTIGLLEEIPDGEVSLETSMNYSHVIIKKSYINWKNKVNTEIDR